MRAQALPLGIGFACFATSAFGLLPLGAAAAD
ncbi:cytochrome c, partial [Sinorhizobium meliloti]